MRSFQDIIRGRQQEGFVGRGGELAQFAANLAISVDDPARRFVFSVHGDGGVGKSTLLRELRRIATERGALCAGVDEHFFGLPETMNGLASDILAQKVKLPGFSKLYATYLRRLTEAQSDPGAPDGFAHFVTRTAVQVGLHAAQAVPVAGVAAAAVDSEEAAQQADRLRAFLGSKFRKHEEVRMLMSPADVLTPALVRDLASAGAGRVLVLFFDTYEQTGALIDPWLRSMLEGRFGSLPPNLVVVIAGRKPLDQASWAPFLAVVAEAPLTSFTEIEARQMLAAKGVTSEHEVAEILAASERLPLLVAMLAQSAREKCGASVDPSDDAVERFLAGEADPVRRTIALTAAVPRAVNEDVLGLLADTSSAGQAELYAWLRSRAFVTHQAGRCQYHDVVRAMMLRQLRGQSPHRWLRARSCQVNEIGGSKDEVNDVSLTWFLRSGLLGLASSRYQAFFSAAGTSQTDFPPQDRPRSVGILDILSRARESGVEIGELEFEAAGGRLIDYKAMSGADVSDDTLLENIGNAIGKQLAVRAVAVLLAGDRQLRCDLESRHAAGNAGAKYYLTELISKALPLLRPMLSRELSALASLGALEGK